MATSYSSKIVLKNTFSTQTIISLKPSWDVEWVKTVLVLAVIQKTRWIWAKILQLALYWDCSRGVAGLRCVSSLSTLFIRDCIHNITQPWEPFCLHMIFIDDKCTVSVGLSLAGYKATYSTWKSSVFNTTDNKLWLYHSSLLFYYGNAVTLPSLPDAINWIINCVSSYWKMTFSLSLSDGHWMDSNLL